MTDSTVASEFRLLIFPACSMMRVKHRVARVPRRQSRLVHVLQCMKYKVHSDEEFRFIHEPRSNDAGESRTCTTSTRTGIYLNSSEPANSTACSISSHSTASTPTPTSSQGSSRECRRVVQLATEITSGNRACPTCRRGSSRGCPCRCRRRGIPAYPVQNIAFWWCKTNTH